MRSKGGLGLCIALATVISCGTVIGCGKDKPNGADTVIGAAHSARQRRDVSDLKAPAFMNYIPADAVMVWASYKPVPQPFLDKMVETLSPLGDILQREITEASADSSQSATDQILLKALDGNMSRAGLQRLGIKFDARFALYNIDASIVYRLELADAGKVDALLQDVARGAEPKGRLSEVRLGEQLYYRAQDAENVIAIGFVGNEVVVVITRAVAEAHVLPIAFLQTKPAKSITDTGTLAQMVGEHGLGGWMPGYIDFRQLAAAVTNPESQIAKTLGITLPPICQSELTALAEVMPRIGFGYTEWGENRVRGVSMVELRKDIADELASLAGSVPGMSSLAEAKSLYAVALAVDMGKALDWWKNKSSQIEAAPYQCEELHWINEIAQESTEGLREVPALIRGFKGLLVEVAKLEFGGLIPVVEGYVLVGMDEPMQLVNMARGAIESLSNLALEPNGKAMKVSISAPLPAEIHAVVKGPWLGVSAGGGQSKAQMTTLVNRRAPSSGPLMAFAMDYGALGKLSALSENTDPLTSALIQSIGNTFGMSRTSISFEPRGMISTYELDLR